MSANEPASTLLRFGIFEADVQGGRLTKRGKRVKLQEQPFRLLVLLLEAAGEVVTREQLRSRLWPQTIVDFDHGLNKAISKIRDALGDSSEHPRFVETIARRGYRFLADVTIVHAPPKELEASNSASVELMFVPPSTKTTQPIKIFGGFAWKLFSVALALALVSFASLAFYYRAYAPPRIRSLAVLPLENLSGDPSQDYVADGMTEELITRLAQINALRVISRTSAMSYKNIHKSLAEIAGALHIDAVVEGSVLRSGERVRVTAKLIDAHNDKLLWAQSYDEDIRDTILLQSTVTREIAEHVRATLNPQELATLAKSRTVKPESYEAYLKGRYFWNKRTGAGLRTAIEYFSRAIETDPTYPEAYSGLADSYALAGDWEYGILSPRDAFLQAKGAATKALALDDQLGEAHTSLALALDLYGWEWEAAEKEFKQAIKLNPGYATAHHWYGWHLMVMEQNPEGILELRKAQSLDPLSLIISTDIADALCIAHRYEESVQESKKALEMDPGFAVGHYALGQALAQKHMHDEAIAAFQRAIELSGHSAAFDSNLAYEYAVLGRKEEALKIAKTLEARQDETPSADANIALIYVGIGDPDQAMDWLNKAYEARFNPSILLRPVFDPLRPDARFQDLLRRLGLPTSKS